MGMNYPRPKITYPRMIFSDTDQINLDESLYVPEMPIPEVAKQLPKSRIWRWDHEPEARAGDLFVFRYDKVHRLVDGELQVIEYPGVYIELDRNPIRHVSFEYWWAPFTLHGLDRGEYMAPGGAGSPKGAISMPLQSIDPDGPLEPVKVTQSQREDAELIRKANRKREMEREQRGVGPGTAARIQSEIDRLDDAA